MDLVCTAAADNHDLPAHITAGHSKIPGVMADAACNDVTDFLDVLASDEHDGASTLFGLGVLVDLGVSEDATWSRVKSGKFTPGARSGS